MGICRVCGKKSPYISSVLEVCPDCVRNRFDDAKEYIARAHAKIRSAHGLPPEPPRDPNGVQCTDC
ncbi:MAG: hypothetical protein QXF11_00225, partial [Candidatus Hadarchaeales archaeon]